VTGEVAIGGIYVPALLLLGTIALVLTGLVTWLMNLAGGYRLVVYRPIVDIAIFVLILGALVMATAPKGVGA
jgi:hypothetical protein